MIRSRPASRLPRGACRVVSNALRRIAPRRSATQGKATHRTAPHRTLAQRTGAHRTALRANRSLYCMAA
ncbi:hypothetical protein C0Z16_33935 [Paraburkholderia rhynchosiae]|uniref:Uncharacterized protein n=1 Tax=Paraburkholderia rhynchosiae TaxID=487049 RepID=A0ABX4UUC1_9BURK|nr:hypothetical protein C0Z16_33935 [Paraburkholderia rhynchosiae]